jgi:hypothetical protein
MYIAEQPTFLNNLLGANKIESFNGFTVSYTLTHAAYVQEILHPYAPGFPLLYTVAKHMKNGG